MTTFRRPEWVSYLLDLWDHYSRRGDHDTAEPVTSTDLPDLIALTANDPSWTWDVCIDCGSSEVIHRALWIRTYPGGDWKVSRTGWCADQHCQADRAISDGLVYVGANGLTQGAPS